MSKSMGSYLGGPMPEEFWTIPGITQVNGVWRIWLGWGKMRALNSSEKRKLRMVYPRSGGGCR